MSLVLTLFVAGSSLRIQMGMFNAVLFAVGTFIVTPESGLNFILFFATEPRNKFHLRIKHAAFN